MYDRLSASAQDSFAKCYDCRCQVDHICSEDCAILNTPRKSTPELTLRPYVDSDWDSIASIHDRARMDELRNSVGIEAFLSLAETAEREELFDGELWVATLMQDGEDQVVGFVAFVADELTWLYVDPLWYRQGVGRSLLDLAISRCGPVMETTVLCGNDAALQLYRSAGFEIVETKTGVLNGNERFPASGHILKRFPT